MSYLPQRTDDQQTKITSDFIPNGRLWEWKSVVSHDGFKWLRAISKAFARIEGILNSWMDSLDITNSTELIEPWEKFAGIPDSSFPGTSTLPNRQKHVITKMCSQDIVTDEDILWLCSKMGLAVNVYPGKYFYDNFDPRVGNFENKSEALFTIVIELIPELSDDDAVTTFPLPFPVQFGLNNYGVMKKHILTVVPSYVNVRWIIADMETWLDTSYSDEIKTNTTDSENIIQSV